MIEFMVKPSYFQHQNPLLTWILRSCHTFQNKLWNLRMHNIKKRIYCKNITQKSCLSSIFTKSRQLWCSHTCTKDKLLENMLAKDNKIRWETVMRKVIPLAPFTKFIPFLYSISMNPSVFMLLMKILVSTFIQVR